MRPWAEFPGGGKSPKEPLRTCVLGRHLRSPLRRNDYGMDEDLPYTGAEAGGRPPSGFHLPRQAPIRLPSGLGDGWAHCQGLKIYLDGSPEVTAALSAPHADDPAAEGQLNWTDCKVLRLLREARAGVQTMLHAIGDRALTRPRGAWSRLTESSKASPTGSTTLWWPGLNSAAASRSWAFTAISSPLLSPAT